MKAKYPFAEKFRDQILRCSSCGFCRAVRPVFGLTKRPAFNVRGKMLVLKEVLDGTIELSDDLIETLFYAGTITFISGTAYGERDFTRNFTVVFNNGTATITVNGRTFTSDLKTGVVTGG